MRLGSLFSGIGLLDLGLERAGFATVFQVEYDRRCWPVLERHFPNAERYRDVKTVDWETVPPVDALAGGFPCQPFSAAGLRKGASDDRYLWPEFDRAIRILRPRLVILENVSALLGAPEWGTVLGDLAEAGYDAKWTTVRASDLGAPHKRERVFAVAYASEQPARRFTGPALGTQEERQDAEGEPNCNGSGDGGEAVAYAHGQRSQGKQLQARRYADGCREARTEVHWGTYADAIRRWERLTRPVPEPTDHKDRLSVQFVEWMMGAPGGYTEGMSRSAALHGLGNGVVVQVAEEMGRWALDNGRPHPYAENERKAR